MPLPRRRARPPKNGAASDQGRVHHGHAEGHEGQQGPLRRRYARSDQCLWAVAEDFAPNSIVARARAGYEAEKIEGEMQKMRMRVMVVALRKGEMVKMEVDGQQGESECGIVLRWRWCRNDADRWAPSRQGQAERPCR